MPYCAGRLHDDGILGEDAFFFSGIDHRHANAVLHAAERIEEFAFEENRGFEALGDTVQLNQRRVAHGLDDIVKILPMILRRL